MQIITRDQVRGMLAMRQANELARLELQQVADALVQEHGCGYPDLDAMVDALEFFGERPTFRERIEQEAALADLFDAEAEERGLPVRARRK